MMDFLASLNLSVHLTSIPFETREDVLAVLPAYMREDVGNEVLDAIVDALLALSIKRASDQAEYAAQANPVYAEGRILDKHGKSVDVARAEGEDDESYRTQMLDPTLRITPAAVIAAVKEIIAPYTDAEPWYAELPDDGAFLFQHETEFTNKDGAYIEVDEGVEGSERFYDSRPNSRPRHWFLWGSPTVGNNTIVSANLYGHALLGIPAFPLPDDGGEDDDFFFGEEDGAYTFDLSDLSTYPEESNPLFAFGSEAVLVVAAIRRVIDESLPFPNTCDIVLDPTLEA